MPYVFEAKIRPNSSGFSIEIGEKIVVHTKSQPENNKANTEIVKSLSKLLNTEVRILKGLKSKNKAIWVGCSEAEFKALRQI